MPKETIKPLRFTGENQRTKVKVKRKDKEEELYPYIPDPKLVQAVNLALLLEKPLLVMGEPGCGKSLLAKSIAYDLYRENMYDYYEEWPVKSLSKAKEGLYEFDQIHRLRDATVTKDGIDITQVSKYIHLGPMGRAFEKSTAPDKRFILLIDEIDKADIDFPNDLLNELDRMEFEIPELKVEEAAGKSQNVKSVVKAAYRPIVIITSNSEKELPDAFLRRCIFHYIEPLTEETLRDIVKGRYYSGNITNEELVTNALKSFTRLRDTIKTEVLTIGKTVSTSEFLDWFQALKHFSELEKDEAEKEKLKDMIAELDNLESDDVQKIPFNHVLLKNINSVLRFNTHEEKPQS